MRRFSFFSTLLILAVSLMMTTSIKAQTFQVGDVFASISCGEVNWFSNTGVLKGTLNTGTGSSYTTGMCFDQAGNLYVTTFGSAVVSKFDNHGTLIASNWAQCDASAACESIHLSPAGNFYVGQATGSTHDILEFSSSGGFPVNRWTPATENRGTDWIDLGPDQCTMYYTSEGYLIKRFDICTNTQLADFTILGSTPAYALRIAADHTVLVAESDRVERWSADGSTLLNTYFASTYNMQPGLFALNLDPDGITFWTSDFDDNLISRINIATGALITQFNAQACSGNYGLAVYGELLGCPQVLMNPQSDTVGCDSIAVTSTVNSDGKTTVQWQVSTDGGTTWTNIAGADSTTYIFPSMASDNGNEYRAVFTDTVSGDNCPNDTSASSVVYVGTHLISQNPTDQLACKGFTATFTSAAIQNPVPTVQWYRSTNSGGTWTAISGATSATYTTGAVTTSMNGYEYEAVYTYPCTNATTSPATLTVGTAPLVTSNPSPTTENVCAGTTASWSVSASGIPTPGVQWQVSTDQGNSWTDIPGANSTTLSFTTTASESGYKYRAVFTNDCGTATSRNASLVVPYAPGTPTCPSNVTARQGGNALFNSTATGFPTPTVQWQVSTNGGGSWSNISGATANTLTLHNVTLGMNGYEYHAVFTNGCGTSTSCAATLTVD